MNQSIHFGEVKRRLWQVKGTLKTFQISVEYTRPRCPLDVKSPCSLLNKGNSPHYSVGSLQAWRKKTVMWYDLFLTWLNECCRGRQQVWSSYFLLPTLLSVSLSPLTSNLRFPCSCHCLHYLWHTLLCLDTSTISIVFLIAPLCLLVPIYFLQYER